MYMYIYIIVTDMEGTDQWKEYCSSRRRGKYQFHGPYHDSRAVCLSILILPSISVTIVFIALKTRI